jgi:hypothetical protein
MLPGKNKLEVLASLSSINVGHPTEMQAARSMRNVIQKIRLLSSASVQSLGGEIK